MDDKSLKNNASGNPDRLSWDEYFMGIALMSAKRSADPSSQVGCVIVKPDNRIVSLGYNGFPKGIEDGTFSWQKEGEWIDTKYPYVIHAEINAILNSRGADLTGCRVYVTLAPCNECAKCMVQAGINELIYYEDKYPNQDIFKASKIVMDKAGVKYRQYQPKGKNIEVRV